MVDSLHAKKPKKKLTVKKPDPKVTENSKKIPDHMQKLVFRLQQQTQLTRREILSAAEEIRPAPSLLVRR